MKTRFVILILIFFGTMPCVGQETSENFERERWSCIEHIEITINRYADSLNFWTQGMALPKFVSDPMFDQRFTYSNYCLSVNWIFSYRKLILDRVVNTDVLNVIIDSKDARLDSVYVLTEEQIKIETPNKYIRDFPYATHSTRSLTKRRLNRIDYTKKMLLGK